ncbi:Pecanex-like protein 2 [Myotis davidii]|uniref:Pecanex-like protein n=1 Tax=Myotis davidii TaxID=225400 RepID=L5M742_MYODS|nr:Pecanex-like protein 2 [Myotis davidii]
MSSRCARTTNSPVINPHTHCAPWGKLVFLALPPNAVTVILYCSSVTVFFAIIKLVSYRLHLMFDEGEAIQRRPSGKREKCSKHRETHSEHTPSHKAPSNNQLTSNGKKGEADRNCCTPPLRCGSQGQNSGSHRSSGLLELPAQETVEDLKGVILAEDQPVAPVSPTPPGVKTDSSPPSKAPVPGARTLPAVPAEPGVAGRADRGRGGGGRGQPPLRHRSEGGLEEAASPRTGVSYQPWGSENSVLTPEPGNDAQGSARGQLESLSRSWPQCHAIITNPGYLPGDPSRQADPPLNPQGDVSEGEVAVTLIDTSEPGDLHEPIKIVITMSSARGSMTDLDSSLHLQGVGPRRTGPPHVEQSVPIITLELSEDGDQRAPERWMVEAPSAQRTGWESGDQGNATEARSPSLGRPWDSAPPEGERGRVGPASLDPSSCKSSQEKRHARVLSMDSGTEVFLSRSHAEVGHEKERAMPTSKSDLEAKEGQTPNESNFLEFVSLLESISTAKVGAPGRRRGPPEPGKDGGLPGDNGSQERKNEIPESGRSAKHGKPDVQSQELASPSPARTEPAKVTALFQGNRQRRIIYRVTSQQDSSVLQVISGPETSMQEESSGDAMHVFIDEHDLTSNESCPGKRFLNASDLVGSCFVFP